jgi:hypothetical protein
MRPRLVTVRLPSYRGGRTIEERPDGGEETPGGQATGHHEGTGGQSQAGSLLPAGRCAPILTVLKRSLVLWVKEATK